MRLCSCFGPSKAERREADRFEAEEARARAAEAAQKRQFSFPNPPSPLLASASFLLIPDLFVATKSSLDLQEQFEKSAAGRAARAQIAATKKSSEPSKGEPVLKATKRSCEIAHQNKYSENKFNGLSGRIARHGVVETCIFQVRNKGLEDKFTVRVCHLYLVCFLVFFLEAMNFQPIVNSIFIC
ncbi:hypothetical protein MUK42_15893 [Musa troglodytarum]|uniref:Uncharacterized protein n=1 Tax=Musa troglodytarum TaxID=320322 RepID=A0A9E7H5B5_9LILI|nr:hypothetical protein MUK42_15893 [Musa troglodytarum]